MVADAFLDATTAGTRIGDVAAGTAANALDPDDWHRHHPDLLERL
ncbi:hypothetical protein ACU61A_14010 [Pseudonocardia sichuanensis]